MSTALEGLVGLASALLMTACLVNFLLILHIIEAVK